MSNYRAIRRWAVLAAALAFLNASLTFVNVWPTPAIRWNEGLSVEAALCVFALVLAGRRHRPSARALRWLGVFWVALVVGRYVDVTVQALYGRQINLYWDMRHMSAVGAMLAVVTKPWLVAGVVAAVVLIPIAIYLPLRWALGHVSGATADPRARRALAVLAAAGIILFAVMGTPDPEALEKPLLRFAAPVTPTFARQVALFAEEASGAGMRELGPPPTIDSDLSLVEGADVFVIFFESYGAVSWDRPAFAQQLAPSRRQFDADIHDTGRDVVSAFVQSPTFGGGSWLAHVSLLSGTEVRDDDANVRLMAQQRDTMVKAFGRHGYHTVAIMPGMQKGWPEGAFYGFDDIYGVERLDYKGPIFGWWDLTDQFALARMDALVVAPQPRPPVFVFFPTVSTHTPFAPTPPYQSDWARMLTPKPYDEEELHNAWSDLPDWENLGPSYVQSLAYTYSSVGGYLRLRADRDFVIVLLGDHQPPALVSGEGATWEVPVHVITSRRAVLDRLIRQGFRAGLAPQHPVVSPMHSLMPLLLGAFGEHESPVSSTAAAHR